MKKFKNNFSFLKILGLFLIFLFLSACSNGMVDLKINEKKIRAEIAADAISKAKGLSDREELCKNCGMVFVFGEESKHTFWMKDMNFPLDIIYVNNDQIVEIFDNVQIYNDLGEFTEIFPNKSADKVLELNAGWCEKNNVLVGDKIEL